MLHQYKHSGTKLNKAYFDTIQTDVNNLNTNKLNVSAKATQADAIAGTDNTKYITPYALAGKIKKLNITGSCTTITAPPHQTDVIDFTAYANKRIFVTGTMVASGYSQFETAQFVRLYVNYNGTNEIIIDTTRHLPTYFKIEIDTKYGTIKFDYFSTSDNTLHTEFKKYTNLTKFYMSYNGTNTTYDLTFEILD